MTKRREDAWPRPASALPPGRLAVAADAPRISELMRVSVLELFPHFYDQRQTASAAVHIAHLDTQLIEDGTYFVHEVGDEIVELTLEDFDASAPQFIRDAQGFGAFTGRSPAEVANALETGSEW